MCSWKTRDRAGGAKWSRLFRRCGSRQRLPAPRRARGPGLQGTQRWWGRCPCLWGPAGRGQAMGPALPLFVWLSSLWDLSSPTRVELGSQQ